MTNDESQQAAPVVVVGAGQAGLAAARAVAMAGFRPVVLDAAAEVGGSWPLYYDSLTLFSHARFSELPGRPFGADRDRLPRRDEVTAYLRDYAAQLGAEVRTGERVVSIERDGSSFLVRTATGKTIEAAGVVSASGGFTNPYLPDLPGLGSFGGLTLHAGEYRDPARFANMNVVVVGAGNSAVQIAVELAETPGAASAVTLATREPIRFVDPSILGRDLHWWLVMSRIDRVPVGRWLRRHPRQPVIDLERRYSTAVARGRPARRAMFTAIEGDHVLWPDGSRERVDAIIVATGYRPAVEHLAGTGALDADDLPRHRDGVSTTVAGLGYVGLEWQRSFRSATLRGVGPDAQHVVRRLRRRWLSAGRDLEDRRTVTRPAAEGAGRAQAASPG